MEAFRTIVKPDPFPFQLHHESGFFLLGSCFSTHMAERLQKSGFRVQVNPFGVIFHPFPLSAILGKIINGEPYQAADLTAFNSNYHSLAHHGDFHHKESTELLQLLNARLQSASEFLSRTSVVVISLGTAWGWEYQQDDEILVAANCHRLPGSFFNSRLYNAEQIAGQWKPLLLDLKKHFPQIQVVFTVSPVRYLRQGAHNNQLSKAKLLLAVDSLCRELEHCHYFAAYELLMDDLRDYRFYADDMVHISSAAADYVFDAFAKSILLPESVELGKQIFRISQIAAHRPKDPQAHRSNVQRAEEQVKQVLREQGYEQAAVEFRLSN